MLEGDLEEGERACRESLMLLGSGEEWYRAVALNVLGTAARYRGRREEARRLYDEALALAATGGPVVAGRARAVEPRRARRARGPPCRGAWSATSRPSVIAREGGDVWMLAASLTNAGRAVRRLGDLDRASAMQAEALRSFVALENAWGIAVCVDALATLAGDRGHHVRAARLYGAEEAIRERARIALWPTIRADHEAGMEATASALGPTAWARARAEGRALTQDEAIAQATLQLPVPTG